MLFCKLGHQSDSQGWMCSSRYMYWEFHPPASATSRAHSISSVLHSPTPHQDIMQETLGSNIDIGVVRIRTWIISLIKARAISMILVYTICLFGRCDSALTIGIGQPVSMDDLLDQIGHSRPGTDALSFLGHLWSTSEQSSCIIGHQLTNWSPLNVCRQVHTCGS
jgi:hypothetical protein